MSELPPELLPELSFALPPDMPPEVPPELLPEVPPDVVPPGTPPGLPSVVPLLVRPADGVPLPGVATFSGGACLADVDEELALSDVRPPLCSELLTPPRLQATRLIVNSPRTAHVFDAPRLDLMTIPFKSGCLNLCLD